MRDNEVHLPCSVSKDALLNDFNFYGFQVDSNSIKTTFISIAHIADELQCWEIRYVDKLNELKTIGKNTARKIKTIDINTARARELDIIGKNTALEVKYIKFCFMLSQHYISKRKFQLKMKYNEYEKYGSFYTHNDFREFDKSTRPPSKFLKDKILQKCANLFQISHITAYYNSSMNQYHVKFGILKSNEEKSLIAGELSEGSEESKNEDDDSSSSDDSTPAPYSSSDDPGDL